MNANAKYTSDHDKKISIHLFLDKHTLVYNMKLYYIYKVLGSGPPRDPDMVNEG
jgi:hypothetical protein